MTLSVTHTYVSSVADSSAAAAAGKILPQSHWNAQHAVSGNLPVSQLNSGAGAGPTTFWCGDETWKLPPSVGGSGTVLGWVNVKDFGAVGDNSHDDTAAIQAAIDYAYAHDIQTTYIPPGTYKITAPLWLDPPLNMRASPPNPSSPAAGAHPPNFASPPDFQFSLSLQGEPGLPNETHRGSQIWPTFNNDVAVYIGPGNGMRIGWLTIIGPSGLWHGQQNINGVGVGVTGTGGGSSRTLFEHVGVVNFYTAFKTSANGNGTLGDSNTFVKCDGDNLYYGFWIAGNQNFINSFYDCNVGGTVCLYNDFGNGCRVFGGNWSSSNTVGDTFTLSSVGSFGSAGFGNGFNYSFVGTISGGSPGQLAYVNTAFTAYAIKTANFGIIPLQIDAYNSSTHVANFTIRTAWSIWNYPSSNALSTTDIQAEITACTSLYASERVTTFWGNGIHVKGVHIENAWAPTCLIRTGESFGSNNNSTYEAIQFNYDPSLDAIKSTADPRLQAHWYIQQSWPFIDMEFGSSQVTLRDSQLSMGGNEPVLIEILVGRFVMKEMTHAVPMNVKFWGNGGFTNNVLSVNVSGLGGGEYDVTPFLSKASQTTQGGGDAWRAGFWGQAPQWGFRPASHTRPVIPQGGLETLAGTLPAITNSGGSGGSWSVPYPLIWGAQIYAVAPWNIDTAVTTQAVHEFNSKHRFYTYGQDLTTTNVPGLSWSYKGQTNVVYADALTLEIIFPGLQVILNDGVSDVPYMVTGVYHGLGYFTTMNATSSGGNQNNSGLKTSTFTGTTIKQAPFAIQVLSGPQTPVTKTGDFAPTAVENNIIVNKGSTCTVTLPSAATYNGRTIRITTIQAQTVVSISSNVVPLTGGGAGTAILAATAGKWALLISDGTNWVITEGN